MADRSLIDFSEQENDENRCPDEYQVPRAPKLVQSPVIKNPILKQSTKDNLIQLYTPVQRPVKGKLKVTFGEDSVLQTPVTKKSERRPFKLSDVSTDKEKEEWEERTSILTKFDHQDYTTYATEIVNEIIQSIPIKEEEAPGIDSGLESDAMDCSEYEQEPSQMSTTAGPDKDTTMDMDDFNMDVLSRATELLKALEQETYIDVKKPEEGFHVPKEPAVAAAESEEEFMDCEEYMEVNDDANTRATVVTDKPVEVIKTEQITDANCKVQTKATDIVVESSCETNKEMSGNNKPESNKKDGDFSMENKYTEGERDKTTSDTKDKDVDTTHVSDSQPSDMVSEHAVTNDIEASKPTTNFSPDNIEEQPILPKKGTYNLDDIQNAEEMPILPRKGVYDLNELDSKVEVSMQSEIKDKEGVKNTEDQPILPEQDDNKDKKDDQEEKPSLPKTEVNLDCLNNTEEQPILPKKGVYTLDEFDNSEQPSLSKNNDTEEQPILPKKGVYNLDGIDNLEEQPILPKKGVYNLDGIGDLEEQPILPKKGVYNLDGIDNLEEQPILPKKGVYNLDEIDNSEDQSSVSKADVKEKQPSQNGENLGNSEVQPNLSKEDSQCTYEGNPAPPNTGIENNNLEEQPIVPNKGVYDLDKLDDMEEQPILPKKGTYNLDDLDFESMDPFKTKSQVANTPDKSNTTKTASKANTELDKDKNTKAGCQESAHKKEGNNETFHVKKENQESGNAEHASEETGAKGEQQITVEDPFKPRNQTQNSPLSEKIEDKPNKTEDPFKPRNQMQNSPIPCGKSVKIPPGVSVNVEDEDPLKPKSQIINSPAGNSNKPIGSQGDTVGSNLTTEKQIHNSSATAKSNHMSTEKQKDISANKDDSADAGKSGAPSKQMQKPSVETDKKEGSANVNETPKLKVGSLPMKLVTKDDLNLEEIEDPFKPKKQMQNSPVVKENTKDALNLDEIEDPFKPKRQMQNSPLNKGSAKDVLNLDEIEDPFKPKKQMQNSPAMKENAKEGINLDEIEDPFKPKTQMQNSPLSKEDFITDVMLEDIEDSFQPKTQMQNSPLLKEDFITDIKLEDIEDPFKPKMQMQNSPLAKDLYKEFNNVEDPFKASNGMQNSPVSKCGDIPAEEFDSQKHPIDQLSDKKVDDAFDFFDIEDPFKPKAQMQTSPVSKPNSIGEKACKPKDDTDRNGKVDKTDAFDDLDPFKSRRQIPQSPIADKPTEGTQEGIGENMDINDGKEKVEVIQLKDSAGKSVAGVSLFPDVLEGEVENDFIEVTSVTRRGEQPKDAVIGDFDALDIDESQFVSAAKVFNDPGMLDLLENFGNQNATQQESSLSRMSLYVKFDPLVEAAPNRRISIRPSQLEKMKEFGLDETLLLLGTPPKKKRQTMSVSSNKNTPNAAQLIMGKGKEPLPSVNAGAVDMILACSPGKLKDTPTSGRRTSIPSLLGDSEEGQALFEELKYTEKDLRQLKETCRLEMQGLMLEKEKEWYNKEQARQQEKEKEELMIKDLQQKYKESEAKNKEFVEVFNMYEQTMLDLSEKHKVLLQEKDDKIKAVEVQRDTAYNDIKSVDNAFSELHTRYDKVRNIIDVMKKNEEALKKYIAECHDKLKQKESSNSTMKKTYEEKSKKMQQETEKLKQQISDLHSKIAAQAKVSQMKIESLEKQIVQKTAENKELTDICDNLLASHSDA